MTVGSRRGDGRRRRPRACALIRPRRRRRQVAGRCSTGLDDDLRDRVEGPLERAQAGRARSPRRGEGFWEDNARFASLGELRIHRPPARRCAPRSASGAARSRAGDDAAAAAGPRCDARARACTSSSEALRGRRGAAPRTRSTSRCARSPARRPTLALRLRRTSSSRCTAGGRERRGMAVERLPTIARADVEDLLLAGGLGAATILAPEARAPRPRAPGHAPGARARARAGRRHGRGRAAASAAAGEATSPRDGAAPRSRRAPARTAVVRRYRFEPTPLVRDAVRGFRTGRLDRVLAGDFDLF